MNTAEQARQAELRRYAVQQAIVHQNDIAPELLDYATAGESREAIDASIERAKQKSAQLVQRALQGQIRPSDQDDPGPGFTANVREGIGNQQPLTADAVAGLSMDDYAKLRAQLGIGQSKGVGILGPIGR